MWGTSLHKNPFSASLFNFSSQTLLLKPPLIVGGGCLTDTHACLPSLRANAHICGYWRCSWTPETLQLASWQKHGWAIHQRSDQWKDLPELWITSELHYMPRNCVTLTLRLFPLSRGTIVFSSEMKKKTKKTKQKISPHRTCLLSLVQKTCRPFI